MAAKMVIAAPLDKWLRLARDRFNPTAHAGGYDSRLPVPAWGVDTEGASRRFHNVRRFKWWDSMTAQRPAVLGGVLQRRAREAMAD
jgi:hypothetical protein